MAIKRCISPFSVWDSAGTPRVIAGGELIADSDPAYAGHEAMFEDVETHVERTSGKVEQATAEPGEKRTVSTRGRSAKRTSGETDKGK